MPEPVVSSTALSIARRIVVVGILHGVNSDRALHGFVRTAIFVWSVHLGLVTGDWDGYIFVGATLLVLQGILASMHALIAQSPNHIQTA
jgi:hypothetical protein